MHAGVGVGMLVLFIYKNKKQAGAAICSLSICKLAAAKVLISHIASKARGLRGLRHVDGAHPVIPYWQDDTNI
jgi:hypothetical protein